MARKAVSEANVAITISSPKFDIFKCSIIGSSPFVSNKFSEKARIMMEEAQMQGQAAKTTRKREPKDFESLYLGSMHLADSGDWYGIPCSAFRSAMIKACSIVGVHMTKAKMCVFVEPDGFSREGTALVRITKGEPKMFKAAVILASGVPDISARGMWMPGWEAELRIRYDSDIFSPETVANLLMRAGLQVGVGAGRHASERSSGQGWGEFMLKTDSQDMGREEGLEANPVPKRRLRQAA
jgi:hypothetical protein